MDGTLLLTPSPKQEQILRTDGKAAGLYLPKPAANGDVHLVWKLKGTGKKARAQTIASCAKAQQVYIICDSNGSHCTVITETGDEIGRLNKTDARMYHAYVEKFRFHAYIKSIRPDAEKPRVKILLIVHERPELSLAVRVLPQ